MLWGYKGTHGSRVLFYSFSPQPPKVKSVKRTKKVAATPYVAKQAPKKETNPLIEKRPKNFGIGEIKWIIRGILIITIFGCVLCESAAAVGGNIQPRRDLTRFVRWPKYVRLQRQRRVLYQRLKVPPTIAQFTQTLDRQNGKGLRNCGEKINSKS